jgi:hypothetical protein
MVIAIPSVGLLLLALLVAYLFLGAPIGNTRSMLVTLINIILFAVVVYIILGLFNVV